MIKDINNKINKYEYNLYFKYITKERDDIIKHFDGKLLRIHLFHACRGNDRSGPIEYKQNDNNNDAESCGTDLIHTDTNCIIFNSNTIGYAGYESHMEKKQDKKAKTC